MGPKEELKKVKSNEERMNSVEEFFNNRDKGNRGISGRVEDVSNTLKEETKEKQELYDKSLELEGIPDHVKPIFNGLFLTARRNKLMENGVYLPTASFGNGGDTDLEVDFSDTQVVLAVAQNVSSVCPGMEVVINTDNFKRKLSETMAQKINKEYAYEIPVKVIEGVEYIGITERDISYISNTNGVSFKEKEK